MIAITLTIRQIKLLDDILKQLIKKTQFLASKEFVQHGKTSVFNHSLNVATISLKLACFFNINIDEKSLITGALLHDYFLYDWHDKQRCPSWHCFKHPKIALENAKRDFYVNTIEEDIIINHMFPLTLNVPKTKEGWLVSIADKFCCIVETFRLQKYQTRQWNIGRQAKNPQISKPNIMNEPRRILEASALR
ncbi:MAG: HD domain-containing protein [Treponema sp.]|nr:HD domain-containing protein [Treponema sp.]